VAMTEPGGGSDLKAIRTTAVREGDEYVINGSKTFISNGFISDLVVVVVKTDPAAGAKGVSLLLVETNREGFRRGRKLDKVGMHSQDTAELFFDNVRVPVSNRLGEEGKGFIYLMQELPQERFMIAVTAAAKLEKLLEQTIDYVKDRRAFNQTVWDFQNTKFKLADVKAQAVALRTMVDYYLGEHMRRRLTVEEAAIAKLHSTETLWKCIDDMVQLHGGYGYMLEYPIARDFVDSRVNRIYGGTSEVMRELIARKL
jgi:acyl-CoA dehydrogenase